AVNGVPLLLVARHGRDDPGLAVHLADDGVEPVDNVQVAVAVYRDGIGLVEGRLRRRPAVAPVALAAAAGDGGDGPRPAVDPPDAVVAGLRDVEVAGRVDVAVEGLIEAGFRRRPAVAGVALPAGAGDGFNGPRRCRGGQAEEACQEEGRWHA